MLRPREVFEVRLHGNETIDPPVSWTVNAVPRFLERGGEVVVSDSSDAPGAGATWIFRFTAVAEGRGRLTFSGGESGRRKSFEILSDDTIVYD